MLFQDKRGFTLTELIVVMGIFLTVIMITASAFKTIANNASQQSKSVETQIQGIVGLEVLRADLESAGFGLPWEASSGSPSVGRAYAEAVFTNASTGSLFNDGNATTTATTAGNAPRPVLSGNSSFNKVDGVGSKYLVIKSTMAVANATSRKWTTVAFDKDGNKSISKWGATDRDLAGNEQIIVLKNSLTTSPHTRKLMVSSGGAFFSKFSSSSNSYMSLIGSPQNGQTFEVYGINETTDLRMPFNRADYYVSRPAQMPASCAPKTGILYKATVSHTSGNPTPGVPLLDCVADMQVVYGLGPADASTVNYYSEDISDSSLYSAAFIRSTLKEIRVYILAQEGKKDIMYNYSSASSSATVRVGEKINGIDKGRSFSLKGLIGSDYKQYHWKLYTIVVRPKNLVQ